MSDTTQIATETVAKIHKSPYRFVLAITGGGSSALSTLLSVAGASNTVLEGHIPYSAASLENYLNFSLTQACSEETARHMAMQAFNKAKNQTSAEKALGLGCTAALQTDRDRKGQDVCYIAIQSHKATAIFTMHLDKNMQRNLQEEACCFLIIAAMAKSCGLKHNLPLSDYQHDYHEGPESWQHLQAGKLRSSTHLQPRLIFPGAFNPPHVGHKKIVQIAERKTNQKLYHEISICNVDKANIDFWDMYKRQEMLESENLIFTRAATFIEKSALFPAATFVVGIDTLSRIIDLKYYENQVNLRDDAISSLINNQHRFLVFGREVEGQYLSLSDLEIEPNLRSICDEVSEDEFREDISSSHIRAAID